MLLLLLIIGLAEVASGVLVHVAATAVEDVVPIGHSLCLLSVSAGGCSRPRMTCLWQPCILQPWRVYSSEDRFDCLLCRFDPRLLWVGGGFAWSRLRRSQDVCLKLDRRTKHKGVQLRLRDFQILADLLQRESASVHDQVGDIPG